MGQQEEERCFFCGDKQVNKQVNKQEDKLD
jgi:hypothetical protein